MTSNLTADVTVNPDFSQVESDLPQIEVNQRFALFYPELRPFFLEGAEIFAVDSPIAVLHTRRIVDPLLGAKLTGKVGRTTVGVMYADDEAPGDVDDPEDPLRGLAAQTFVGRVRFDLYPESHVGAIFTDRELHDSHSRLAGFDSNFRLNDTHSVSFRAMRTAHRGLDGRETEGHLHDAHLRMQGRHLRYAVRYFELSPEFRTDVGFVRRTDQRVFNTGGQYVRHPETWLQRWGPEWTYQRNHDFDGHRQDETIGGGMNFAFARNSFVATNFDRVLERYEGSTFSRIVSGYSPAPTRAAASGFHSSTAGATRSTSTRPTPISATSAVSPRSSTCADLAAEVRAKHRHEPLHRPAERRRGRVRGAHRAGPHDVAV